HYLFRARPSAVAVPINHQQCKLLVVDVGFHRSAHAAGPPKPLDRHIHPSEIQGLTFSVGRKKAVGRTLSTMNSWNPPSCALAQHNLDLRAILTWEADLHNLAVRPVPDIAGDLAGHDVVMRVDQLAAHFDLLEAPVGDAHLTVAALDRIEQHGLLDGV